VQNLFSRFLAAGVAGAARRRVTPARSRVRPALRSRHAYNPEPQKKAGTWQLMVDNNKALLVRKTGQ
jgi:hypothetical protein